MADLIDSLLDHGLSWDFCKASLREEQLNLFEILFAEFEDQSRQFLGQEFELVRGLVDAKNYHIVNGRPVYKRGVLKDFHERADQYMGASMARRVEGKSKAFVKKLYDASKELSAKELRQPVSFSLRDRRTIKRLNGDMMFWVRDAYNSRISERVNFAVAEVVSKGLPAREAAQQLKATLGATYGGSAAYWDTVASAAAGRARAFGRMNEYVERGVTEYEITNPMDNKTTLICQYLNGMTFTVDEGAPIMNNVMGAKTPDDVKAAHPWVQFSPQRAAKGLDALYVKPPGQRATFLAGSRGRMGPRGNWVRTGRGIGKGTLSGNNIMMPPFHARCRSDVIVSRQAIERWKAGEDLRESVGQPKPMFQMRLPPAVAPSVPAAAVVPPVGLPKIGVADAAWMQKQMAGLGLESGTAKRLSANLARMDTAHLLDKQLFDELLGVRLAPDELKPHGWAGSYNRYSRRIKLSSSDRGVFVHELGHHRWFHDPFFKGPQGLQKEVRKQFIAAKHAVLDSVDRSIKLAGAGSEKAEALKKARKALADVVNSPTRGINDEMRRKLWRMSSLPTHSNYALHHVDEYFADGFEYYFTNPKMLQKKSPDLFATIRSYLGQ